MDLSCSVVLTYPTLTPAANLYENKAEAKSNHILISVNRIVAKSAIFKSSNLAINGSDSPDGTS